MAVKSEAVLLFGFMSPPPDTATLFVSEIDALFATFTVSVIGGYALLPGIASGRLQVTVCPLGGPQVHPDPVAEIGVSPVGNVSLIATAPLLAPRPELVTTIEY